MSEPTYRCLACHDDPAGWMPVSCRELPCGRHKPHPPHGFAVRCPCWLTANADAIRHRAQESLAKARGVSVDMEALEDVEAGRYRYGLLAASRGCAVSR